MKVILLENVDGMGKAGELVNAKPGYFRNFLAPKRLAVEATKENIKTWKEEQKRKAKIAEENKQLAYELKDTIEKTSVVLKMKSGEDGKLFGSITSSDIAKALNDKADLDIDRKKVELKENIKHLGEHIVPVRVYPELTADLKVIVEEE